MSDTSALLETTAGDAAAVIDTAQAAVELRELDPAKLYANTSPNKSELVDLEKFRERPDRARGTYKISDVRSFNSYVDVHKVKGHTTIWVHPTSGKIVAVFDDNAEKKTAWRDHKALLELVLTEEWKFWLAGDGKFFDQQAFAERLQDGLPDISEPDGADLLEIATSIQATTEANFRSAVRLDNDAIKMQYDETVDATAGEAGDLEIPRVFKLSIAPFVGEDEVELKANLRYQVRGGNLALGYKLEQPDRVVREALDLIADALAAKFDRVYRGEPAA